MDSGIRALSSILIDVDKDWAGKKITNLGAPASAADALRRRGALADMPDMALNKLMLGQGSGSSPIESAVPAAGGLAFFGDGSDGDITISADTNLVRDMFYNTLTVDATFTLSTRGYRVFVKGTLTNNGTIENGGGAGAYGGLAGGAGGTGYTGSMKGGADGGRGNDASDDGEAGDSVGQVGVGGNGGAGGAGSDGGGGAGGAVSLHAARGHVRQVVLALSCLTTAPLYEQFESGAGGGGGGGNSGGGDDGGGGGGSGGGLCLVAAKTIINSGGTIHANGGNGGAGGTGGAGTGGGGGGGGGCLMLVYNSLTTGTEEASGGVGGAKVGTGVAGTNGDAGTVVKLENT